MLALQARGCHNINLVTPSHVVPQVVEAIAEAARAGLRLPIVYNTGGYDSVASLRLLDGLVDIYMPDFKCWRPETGRHLMAAEDYPERAREAIAEMHRQVGVLVVGRDGLARRGVLLRHLVMPGQTDEASAIFEWVAREISPDTVVNVMAQYRPECRVGESESGRPLFADIDRPPTQAEMAAAFAAARAAGLCRFA
jgi:putative pyruvate formate lyase activating enzyme